MNHDFSRGLAAFVLSCLGFPTFSGCHQIEVPAASGQGSFEFLKRPAGTRISEGQAVLTGSEPKDVFMQAMPDGPLVVPVYPPAALAAHAGRVTVVLEITISTDGRVADVRPSFAGIPFNGPYSASFQAAAEVAMAQWKFHPAEMRHFEPRQEGGETIWSLASAEKREMTTEVSFTFTERGGAVLENRKP
jgi:hypothetical protein